MSTLSTVFFVILWFVPLVLWANLIITSRKFFQYLKQHHPQAWRDAGEPEQGVVGDKFESPIPTLLWRRQYRAIADAELQRLGDKAFWGLMGFPLSCVWIVAELWLAGVLRALQ